MNRWLRPERDLTPTLTFAPLAWLKLQYLCHAGDTEVGGFGISAPNSLLYIEDFQTVRQQASPVGVSFQDDAVADFFDRCIDQGLAPQQFGRIWIHTHPGTSAQPSDTDEATFARVFGGCDWALMFILSRANAQYARLAFRTGPGGQMLIPTRVDWQAWAGVDSDLGHRMAGWRREYAANIHFQPDLFGTLRAQCLIDDEGLVLEGPDQLWEERHARDFFGP